MMEIGEFPISNSQCPMFKFSRNAAHFAQMSTCRVDGRYYAGT
jgi:hypothetical protein